IVIASAGQGNTRGQVSLCKIDTFINQSIIAIRTNNKLVNPVYVFYNLKSRYKELRQISDGHSIRGSLTTKIINKMKINLPPIKDQNILANILSSFDEKIEINNEINKKLEEMAQAIFKHWFVDFEFPNENGEPYKSSGGEMVESELGMIPKGWEVKTINDISSEIITGKTPSTKEKENFGGNIPFVKIPDMHGKVYVEKTETYLSEKGAVKNKIVPKNSIMVSCIATPGIVSLAGQSCQTNQQINTIINKDNKMCYFNFFSLRNLSDTIRTLGSSGSATLNLNKNQFSKIKIVVPPKEMTDKYFNVVDKIFETIYLNQKENLKLIELRDTLLPKLMSGEIRVPVEEEK
ncbi:MAG: restriction endonuclease subunit S, partial [Bacillus sp. (in: Bacteria)]|nr:restriction endonuclease subunit S [Bacillus sp. (in: firmicutes)]